MEIVLPRGGLLPSIDIVGAKISIDYFTFLIFVVYIPPLVSQSDLDNLFEFFISLNLVFGKNVCILGDFNLSTYSESLDGGVNILNYFLSYMNLCQSNVVRNSNNRILDLVLNNNKHCKVEPA